MMRAHIESVEIRSVLGQLALELGVDGLERLLGEIISRYAGLVGRHHRRDPCPVEAGHSRGRSRQQSYPAGVIDVPHLLDETTVAVYEHGGTPSEHRGHEGSVMRRPGLINENPGLLSRGALSGLEEAVDSLEPFAPPVIELVRTGMPDASASRCTFPNGS